jgi:hypothetical protein
MPTARESQAALKLVTGAAVATADRVLTSLSGSPQAQRAVLLETIPEVIAYYADGSAALGADFYDDQRELAGVTSSRFTAEPIVLDRTVKTRRAIAWASEPLFAPMTVTTSQRLSGVVQNEVARPYRDTITVNSGKDPASVGWRRVTNQCCGFCKMLAARGAVFRQSTARFASHPHCDCTAEPVFEGQAIGPEADVMQYTASKRSRTPAQKADLRAYLSTYFPD